MENEKDLQTMESPDIVYPLNQPKQKNFSDKVKDFIYETLQLFKSYTWQVVAIMAVTAVLVSTIVAPLATCSLADKDTEDNISTEDSSEKFDNYSYVQNGSISIKRSEFEVSLDSISRGDFYLNRVDDVNGYAYYIGEYTNGSLDGYSATLGIFCDPDSLETINGFFLYTDSQSLENLLIIKELLCDVVLCLYDSETALDNYMTLFSSLRLYSIPSEQVIEVLDGLAYAYGVEGNGMTLLIFPAEDALENY